MIASILPVSLWNNNAVAMSQLSGLVASSDSSGKSIDQIWLWIFLVPLVLIIAIFLRFQKQSGNRIQSLKFEGAGIRSQLDRLESILESDDQLLIIYDGQDSEPIALGNLPAHCDVPRETKSLIEFKLWLTPSSSEKLSASVLKLKQSGTPFSVMLETQLGIYLEATARTSGGWAVLRLRDVSGDQMLQVELENEKVRLKAENIELNFLMDMISGPAWIRDGRGRLKWVNKAYALAVNAENTNEIVNQNLNFLKESDQAEICKQTKENGFYKGRMSVNLNGAKPIFDIFDTKTESGSIGVAIDISELESARANLRQITEFHTQTLNQLATAVAIFGEDRRLQYYNASFQKLWELEDSFLQSKPEDTEFLNTLRRQQKLPEQVDFKGWRIKLQSVYEASEAQESSWYLPDGRTLRVIANPHPQGGVTYIYENVTEKLSLESRFNELIRVQKETLDQLTEAVSVFGSDGRLRLWNPTFEKIWGLSPDELKSNPHISKLSERVKGRSESSLWNKLVMEVTSQTEIRVDSTGRVERVDGLVIDYATVPLADGGMLTTFVNVTDTVNVERALREKNEALELADKLKSTFIHHVSYELRSPLTSIIGFAQLLSDPALGPMTEKQDEYTKFILSSSSALLALIDEILDLATIDAGIMELELEQVSISETVTASIEGLQDRLTESNIILRKQIPNDIGTIVADEKRIRQILYNIISNAVRFSDKGGVVDISCERLDDCVQFTVCDHGGGIPKELLPDVFDNFVGLSQGNKRRGTGLGLPIVKKFVELHGGKVEIESSFGEGTVVKVWLPVEAAITVQQTENRRTELK